MMKSILKVSNAPVKVGWVKGKEDFIVISAQVVVKGEREEMRVLRGVVYICGCSQCISSTRAGPNLRVFRLNMVPTDRHPFNGLVSRTTCFSRRQKG